MTDPDAVPRYWVLEYRLVRDVDMTQDRYDDSDYEPVYRQADHDRVVAGLKAELVEADKRIDQLYVQLQAALQSGDDVVKDWNREKRRADELEQRVAALEGELIEIALGVEQHARERAMTQQKKALNDHP